MTIKEIFEKAENGTLTFEQFESAVKEGNAKFVDLSMGEYVSKHKYDNDLSTRDTQISTLNETLTSRDNDLKTLQEQLESAGKDAGKLEELQTKFKELQTTYKTDADKYQNQLKAQAYEFAVKEFANKEKFSSNAAKKVYINEMIAANLPVNENGILGAMDFLTKYKTDNPDSFKVDEPAPNTQQPKPSFAGPTTPQPKPEKKTLTELMQMKNNDPTATINFD